MAKYSNEMYRLYEDLCDNAKSNIEAPILGTMYTPICKSCKNINMFYGTWKDPECGVLGFPPEKYIGAKERDCTYYDPIPNSKWKPYTWADDPNKTQ
ncbi:MAG: hypothetical protein ACOYJD_06945 [Christensenellales bacterium]|jgi:hypothetical protein